MARAHSFVGVFAISIGFGCIGGCSGHSNAAIGDDPTTPGGDVSVTGQGFEPGESVTATLHSNPVLLSTFLPESLVEPAEVVPESPSGEEPGAETFVISQQFKSDIRNLYAETHRQMDRQLLARVMEHTCGNQQQAALLLGIARQTLRVKLRVVGLIPIKSAQDNQR